MVEAGGDGDRIRLSVSDRGPGIPEADRARVVERFVRLEQSRSEPGSGLGLSLASAVAHLHGGELRLEDNGPGLQASWCCPRRPATAAAERIVNGDRRGYDSGTWPGPHRQKNKPIARRREDAGAGARRRAAADRSPRRRRRVVAEWLTEIGRSAAGKALKRLIAAHRSSRRCCSGLPRLAVPLGLGDGGARAAAVVARSQSGPALWRNCSRKAGKAGGAAKSEADAMRRCAA